MGIVNPPVLYPSPEAETTRKTTIVVRHLGCRVEQRNDACIREYIGYDCLEWDAFQTCLAEV
jgi:hypothetical protein